MTYGATESISSGPDFYRLNWILAGNAAKTTEPGLEFTSATGTGNLRYAISRAIIVTGLFGYETFTSNQNLSQTVSGPIALGGVQLNPIKDFQLTAQAGWQFNSPSYQGSLFYQIGAFTSLVGSFSDTVTSPALRITGNLGSLGVNSAGDFYNTNFQVNPATPPSSVSSVSAFNPTPIDGSPITTSIVRYRSGTLSLVHISGRTQYRMTGFHTDYDTLTQFTPGLFAPGFISPQGTSTGVDFAISRTMTPRLTGTVEATYTSAHENGIGYNLYQSSFNLNYLLSPVMQVYFLAGYSHRSSGAALTALSPLSADYSEAHITVGLHRQFY
jgi:hypothetical protein